MINLDFSLAIALYFSFFLGLIFIVWLNLRKGTDDKELSLDPKYIWHCQVCTYTYINTKEEIISTCPRCSSFNKKKNS